MLGQLQEENQKFRSMIQDLRHQKGFTVTASEKDVQQDEEAEMDRLEKAKGIIEHKIKDQDKQHRKQMRVWDKNIKDKESKLTELERELKEKEQENRISKLKIKEMKRLIKHN